jgi:uncharacterized protein (DUF58 family)
MGQAGSKASARGPDWVDPGYFSGDSATVNTARLLVQLIRPPKGHRTLPTRTGGMLILVTIGVGTAAFNTGHNILYLALSLLLSTLLVSGLLSWINFKGCRWKMDTPQHFRVGETATVYLEVENCKRRLSSYDLSFTLDARSSGANETLKLPHGLQPGESGLLSWPHKPATRGKETLSLKGLSSRYPFGFLQKHIRHSIVREVIVWPARIPYQTQMRRTGPRWMQGAARRRGDGVDLIQLRDYRPGDTLRRIHWKASARVRRLQVKETETEHHEAYALRVSPSQGIWSREDGFEKMCAFAGTLAEDLFHRDALLRVVVDGVLDRRINGPADLRDVLDALALLERQSGASPPSARLEARTIEFYPGPDGSVFAQMGGQHVGQA